MASLPATFSQIVKEVGKVGGRLLFVCHSWSGDSRSFHDDISTKIGANLARVR